MAVSTSPKSLRPPTDILELHKRVVQLARDVDGMSKTIVGVSIGTSETRVAHGLGAVPSHVTVTPYADARWWRTQQADATNVYLAASAAITADVKVER